MLEVALEALRPVVGPVAVGDRAAGASGAEVHHVRLPDGTPAVLKVSPGTSSQHGTDHRREMVFYQQMADRVEVATPAVLALVDSPDASALLLSSHEPRPPADEWTEGEWISLAADLAALHDSTPPRVGPVGEPLWLGSALGDPPVDFVRGYWSTTAAAPYLDGMLAACAGFARVLAGDHCSSTATVMSRTCSATKIGWSGSTGRPAVGLTPPRPWPYSDYGPGGITRRSLTLACWPSMSNADEAGSTISTVRWTRPRWVCSCWRHPTSPQTAAAPTGSGPRTGCSTSG